MSQRKKKTQNPDRWPHGKNREHLWWLVVFLAGKVGGRGQPRTQSAFNRALPEPGRAATHTASPAEPTVLLSQPPVDSAACAVASGQTARRAPHPSANTASGFLTSPRKSALQTVPPRQMPAREATPVKPATLPAAAPSSPPVVDFICRGTALLGEKTWVTGQEFISTRLAVQNGIVPKNLARKTRSLLGGEDFNVDPWGNHVNFGVTQMVITPWPGATQVARRLAPQFFQGANLHPGVVWPAD